MSKKTARKPELPTGSAASAFLHRARRCGRKLLRALTARRVVVTLLLLVVAAELSLLGADLLHARGKIDNRRRKAVTQEEKDECSRKRKIMTEEIRKIRHDINLAKGIFPIIENLKEKLKIEMETEERLLLEKETKNKEKFRRKEEKER